MLQLSSRRFLPWVNHDLFPAGATQTRPMRKDGIYQGSEKEQSITFVIICFAGPLMIRLEALWRQLNLP